MLYKYAFHTLAPSVFLGFCEILLSLHLLMFTSSSFRLPPVAVL